MRAPLMMAERSLYRSTRTYRSSESGQNRRSGGVGLAYHPSAGPMAECNDCVTSCVKSLAYCSVGAAAIAAGCIFPPACPAAIVAAALAQAGCDAESATCASVCAATTCCPHHCSGVPNAFDLGGGCCDSGETCVAENDPNARQGCCPADQTVCAGSCCAKGEVCCVGECHDPSTGTCTAGGWCSSPSHVCPDGTCCPPFSQCDGHGGCFIPPPPPPPPPQVLCPPGWRACGSHCCPPGLQCCSIGFGDTACMTNCLH